ncbi:inositol monophosphatase family protein [Aerococcus urinaeequi]|uniref:Inositol monophosphatase family protein n=1 Tax=Aerococcus urinaeequi TaxID=51665 RepID=A0AA47GAU9_9LACT|nr:inositol monophosphatase family protein [Aerococcus urinaeequi]MDT2762200.1 inositol monophosphatase family protein [Aerococcus urinaeequi]WAT25504.1 inositol monophosphatase family protein [Aerococcus urinaeequi]
MLEARAALVREWIEEATAYIHDQLDGDIEIQSKSNRKDLVTNVDKEVELLFRQKIAENFPEDRYIGEEKMGDTPSNLAGGVWIVDPIDGTANFVLQQNHFAIMVAYYEDGLGKLGVVYDVVQDDYFEAIAGQGIKRNGRVFKPSYTDKPLHDSLIAVNGGMVMTDAYKVQELVKESMGLRIYGSAGIEIIALLKGEIAAYVSPRLQPWDIAAGQVLANEVGIQVSQFTGEPVDLLNQNRVLAAYPSAYRRMIENLKGPR